MIILFITDWKLYFSDFRTKLSWQARLCRTTSFTTAKHKRHRTKLPKTKLTFKLFYLRNANLTTNKCHDWVKNTESMEEYRKIDW